MASATIYFKESEHELVINDLTYWDRRSPVVPTEFVTVFDVEKAFANRQ